MVGAGHQQKRATLAQPAASEHGECLAHSWSSEKIQYPSSPYSPHLAFGCLSKALSEYPKQEEELLGAAGTTGKVNFFRAYKPHGSINPPASSCQGDEELVPIFPISLHMTTKHLPSHRGDIAGIPGREPPASGPASVTGVQTLPSRVWHKR